MTNFSKIVAKNGIYHKFEAAKHSFQQDDIIDYLKYRFKMPIFCISAVWTRKQNKNVNHSIVIMMQKRKDPVSDTTPK